jgi:hypothetical protein
MMFFIECAKCKTKSPPISTTVPPPEGWDTETVKKGVTTETTFVCPNCKKES